MIEEIVLSSLVLNEEYARRVFPFLKGEYFEDPAQKAVFEAYTKTFTKYNKIPTKEVIALSVDGMDDLNEVVFGDAMKLVDGLEVDKDSSIDFLIDETEKFCRDRAIYNALRQSIGIVDGKEKRASLGIIPKLLEDALAVSFDNSIGHDYFEDHVARWEYYNKTETRIPFDIDILNTITQGGLPRKSLTIIIAPTGGGKSVIKCHMAAHNLRMGKNVLYITNELAEEEVSKRIDANLLGTDIQKLKRLSQEEYERKVSKVKEKTTGRLFVKEYPTGTAHAGNFRTLLNELRLKKNFVPDVIYVDYLNICASERIKGGESTYLLNKAIAEELRGLAMQFDVPVVTSSQVNRSGYNNSEIDLTNLSESMGPAHTADFMIATIRTEELDEQGQIMFKQLKNRWGDLARHRKFVTGINWARMSLINIEDDSQPRLSEGNKEERPKDPVASAKSMDKAQEKRKKSGIKIDREKVGKIQF